MVVEPGPKFSVQDVHNGWVKGLKQCGQQVATPSFNLGECVGMFENAYYHNEQIDCWLNPFTPDQILALAGDMLLAHVVKCRPEVVVLVFGHFVTIPHIEMIRALGCRVVYLFTESPYEDDMQIAHAPFADLTIINDPTNLDQYPAGTYYQPHCYDPDLHHPGGTPKWDFTFVGTGFDSRVEFFETVEWGDLNVQFWGNWPDVTTSSPIRQFFEGDPRVCLDNHETADLYRASHMSANLYRRESNRPDLSDGWAMGPREVELAACGTFFLRDPRPESDQVLGMLPSFATAGEFSEQLQFWAARPDARREASHKALSVIADRTFENAARRLLETLDQ